MVHGAAGVADGFRKVTEHLAATTPLWCMTGVAFRSWLDGPRYCERRLQIDADDRCLIEHLSGEPATVYGASSGGVQSWTCSSATHPWCTPSLRSSRRPCVDCPTGLDMGDFFHEVTTSIAALASNRQSISAARTSPGRSWAVPPRTRRTPPTRSSTSYAGIRPSTLILMR